MQRQGREQATSAFYPKCALGCVERPKAIKGDKVHLKLASCRLATDVFPLPLSGSFPIADTVSSASAQVLETKAVRHVQTGLSADPCSSARRTIVLLMHSAILALFCF